MGCSTMRGVSYQGLIPNYGVIPHLWACGKSISYYVDRIYPSKGQYPSEAAEGQYVLKNVLSSALAKRNCKRPALALLYMVVVSHDDVPMVEPKLVVGSGLSQRVPFRNFATGRAQGCSLRSRPQL